MTAGDRLLDGDVRPTERRTRRDVDVIRDPPSLPRTVSPTDSSPARESGKRRLESDRASDASVPAPSPRRTKPMPSAARSPPHRRHSVTPPRQTARRGLPPTPWALSRCSAVSSDRRGSHSRPRTTRAETAPSAEGGEDRVPRSGSSRPDHRHDARQRGRATVLQRGTILIVADSPG